MFIYCKKKGQVKLTIILPTSLLTEIFMLQGPSASAYVTYQKADDALRAIQSVNNIVVDGRTVKTSLGTTKYCSHFMKNQSCPKGDCMYLHDMGNLFNRLTVTAQRVNVRVKRPEDTSLYIELLLSLNQGFC